MLPIDFRRISLLAPVLVLAAVLSSGCDSISDDPYEPVYLVESYQVANDTLQSVRLSRTTSIDAEYDTTALAVRGADVRIHLLDQAGAVESTYRLEERDTPGLYEPATDDLVLPLRTYRLEIDANGDRISSETTVPSDFAFISANSDTVVYQETRQLEFIMTRSVYPSRQTVFIFTSEALDPLPERLTPNMKRWYEDGEFELEEAIVATAPPLNEANYTLNADGTLTVPMPWLMVNFYGPQLVSANAIDDNMLDFVRSHQVQQGGSTLSPGEIPNILDHVEGGTGVFGSYARTERRVYIAEPES